MTVDENDEQRDAEACKDWNGGYDVIAKDINNLNCFIFNSVNHDICDEPSTMNHHAGACVQHHCGLRESLPLEDESKARHC